MGHNSSLRVPNLTRHHSGERRFANFMGSVFASFVFNDDPIIKQFGFALTVGVLIDAFHVRMTQPHVCGARRHELGRILDLRGLARGHHRDLACRQPLFLRPIPALTGKLSRG